MRNLFLTLCLMLGGFLSGYAQTGATVTFKAPLKYAFVLDDQRGGKDVFRMISRAAVEKDFVVNIPSIRLNKGLFYAGCNGQTSWLKISDGDKITVWEEQGMIMTKGGAQQINDYLTVWTRKAYNEIPNLLVFRIESMLGLPADSRRIYPEKEALLSTDVLGKLAPLYNELLEDLSNAKIENAKFVEEQKKLIYFQWIELHVQNIMNVEGIEVPKSISDVILKFKFDDERLLNYPGLGDILRGYFKLVDKNGVIGYNADNYLVAKAACIQNQKIKEFYLADELRQIIQNEWIYRMDKVLASVKPLFKTDAGKAAFSKIVEDYSKIVAAHAQFIGTAAYPFEFEDRNGKMVKLSDFEGKYVFFDCWATWCAPCKYEIPFIQKLEKDLEGKNVRFVSLSMDKPSVKEAWKKYLTDHEMNGVCLITPNAFDHPMVRLYGINSIPRFLLIDKAGKLLSVRARRPHDKVLKLQLLDLVK